MIRNKAQFYLIWSIFGMVCIFSFQQFLQLLNECLLNIGIVINIAPVYLKNIKFLVYIILGFILVFLSIIILRQKPIKNYEPNISSIRKYFIIIFVFGFILAICAYFLMNHRTSVFEQYLQKHNTNYRDIYEYLVLYPANIYIVMFLYFTVLFFILTKEKSKPINPDNSLNDINNSEQK